MYLARSSRQSSNCTRVWFIFHKTSAFLMKHTADHRESAFFSAFAFASQLLPLVTFTPTRALTAAVRVIFRRLQAPSAVSTATSRAVHFDRKRFCRRCELLPSRCRTGRIRLLLPSTNQIQAGCAARCVLQAALSARKNHRLTEQHPALGAQLSAPFNRGGVAGHQQLYAALHFDTQPVHSYPLTLCSVADDHCNSCGYLLLALLGSVGGRRAVNGRFDWEPEKEYFGRAKPLKQTERFALCLSSSNC